jgi:tetratricopeptide (TPR) repeat protein
MQSLEGNLFALAANPFQLAMPQALDRGKLDRADLATQLPFANLLEKAEGRALILTQERAAGQSAAGRLVDADLAQGTELLKKVQTNEGVSMLLKLMERHAKNDHLALQVGQLLYDFDCVKALREFMNRRCSQRPYSARKFNLLGLSYLKKSDDEQTGTKSAVDAFQNAIRCVLDYGPAYLNLAQAYQEAGDLTSARQCLRRYLELSPDGDFAADARQRLATMTPGTGP